MRSFKGIGSAAILFATLMASPVAMSQTATPQTVKLFWELPTTGCEGTDCTKPLTGKDALTAVEVFINTVPIQDTSSMQPTIVLPGTPPPLGTTAIYAAKPGDTLYFRVKMRNGPLTDPRDPTKNLGPFSGQITYLVKAAGPVIPGAATQLRIEIVPPGQ